jgi:crotonobetainyl-CoA:carnitine CoA-transferase CaiB-like acyl-CoA transferase
MSRIAKEALEELLDLARLEAPLPGQVSIPGNDPVLPVRYRLGAAGAAALAATGAAADAIWRMRGGNRQSIAVDVRAAVASLRSTRYLQVNGKPPPPLWDAFSGIYPVRDGRWVSIHTNFANHREAALKVLGGPGDREAAKKATAAWEGLALEDAVHAAGGCAGFVRSTAEWLEHPQSEAVALQPVIKIKRIGECAPQPLPKIPRGKPGARPSGSRPLSGVRVLDLTRVLAGPTGARVLAEHGADVLKVTAGHLPHSGQVDLDTGLGKLSTHIDLRTSEGAETLRALVRETDVFSQSYRPGALAGRGFSAEELAKIRPGIVCVALSAWGNTGPWRMRRGFDTIVQCVSGIAHSAGGAATPRYLPVSAIDYVAGYLMAFGAMVALQRRAREGGSWLVRLSLARTGQWITDRGMVPASALEGIAEEFAQEEIAGLCTEVDAPDGRIRHLKPVVQLSETPGRWDRPPVPLGYHKPEWPPRES